MAALIQRLFAWSAQYLRLLMTSKTSQQGEAPFSIFPRYTDLPRTFISVPIPLFDSEFSKVVLIY